MAFVPVPPKCIDLSNAMEQLGSDKMYNVMGVCVDFLEPTKSGGTDYTIKFTLHDHMSAGWGMPFRFFHRLEQKLPAIQHPGDIVILRNVKTKPIGRGETGGLSSPASSWVVLPHAELDNMTSFDEVKSRARWLGKGESHAPGSATLPSDAELQYAKWLAAREDSSQWPAPQGATHLQLAHIMASNGGTPAPQASKFSLLQDLRLGSGQHHIFKELLGEVRRMYQPADSRTELYITDYTTNDRLYDYCHDAGDGVREGDPFGYIADISKSWPGPWGKRTLMVTAWYSQSEHARQHVKEGSFVYLYNVQVKMDRNGSQLEGHCRDDPNKPTTMTIEVRKPGTSEGGARLTQLIVRKRDYEAEAKAANIRFTRTAPTGKKSMQSLVAQEDDDGPKSKKAKARIRKKMKNKGHDDADLAEDDKNDRAAPAQPLAGFNTNVRCNKVEVPCRRIADILDPDVLMRKSIQGTPFALPFQNCTYKAQVRVVDYFPDHIADFAAPRITSEYDVLSDHEDKDESEVDLDEHDGDQVKWEWRFFLLVEDAVSAGANSREMRQMELLVADTDGDYLLRMDACDLRDRKNAQTLAQLREKLFHLWGDLQERKEDHAGDGVPSARPFECLIKEYGRPCRGGQHAAAAHDDLAFDRAFRLFGTTI